jgi:hypothetical protein
MSSWKRRWLLRGLAPAFAAATVAVPAAAAYPIDGGTYAGAKPSVARSETTSSPYHYRNHRSTVAEEVGAKTAPQVVAISHDDRGFALPDPAVAAGLAIACALVGAGSMAAVQRRIRRPAA